MAVEVPGTVSCPNCQQSLPSGAARCQFCGQPLLTGKPVSGRGVVLLTGREKTKLDIGWKEWGYIICSCLIILDGTYDLLMSFHVIPSVFARLGGESYIGVIGMFEVGMGIALLAQQQWAQFVMKWICILGALNELWVVALWVLLASSGHPPHALALLYTLLRLGYLSMTVFFIVDLGDV